jgi:hypothetical protein
MFNKINSTNYNFHYEFVKPFFAGIVSHYAWGWEVQSAAYPFLAFQDERFSTRNR